MYLLDCSVTEDMATAADGYKWITSAVKLGNRANESLYHLCICGCGLLANQVSLFCQMYSEHVPAVQKRAAIHACNARPDRKCIDIVFSFLRSLDVLLVCAVTH